MKESISSDIDLQINKNSSKILLDYQVNSQLIKELKQFIIHHTIVKYCKVISQISKINTLLIQNKNKSDRAQDLHYTCIYRTFGKTLKRYQTELRHLIQQKKEITVDNGTKSVFSELSGKSQNDIGRQQLSKREKLAMKKQEKRIERKQGKDFKIVMQIHQQWRSNCNPMDQQNTYLLNIIKPQIHKLQRQHNTVIDNQPKQYLPPQKYFQMFCCSIDEVYTRYNKLTQSYKDAYKDSIQYSGEAYNLNHKHMYIFMEEFVKHDWRGVQKMNLSHSKMNTSQWRLMIANAQLFKNVKVLSIASNDIEEITREEFQRLISLTGLIVVSQSQKECKLSSNTRRQLQEYMVHNKNVQVVIYQQSV